MIKLFIEKIKLALQKRTGSSQQKKSYASWVAKGYRKEPKVTFVMQSHDKSLQICHVLPKLRQYKDAEIIVIDDGSKQEHTQRLAAALTGANEFLLRANDLFENVTYDKAIRLANGRYIALMQDDDDFDGIGWVERAIHCSNSILRWLSWAARVDWILLLRTTDSGHMAVPRRLLATSLSSRLSTAPRCGSTASCSCSICTISTSALRPSSSMTTNSVPAPGSLDCR